MGHGYPSEALCYDAQAETWTLKADFDASWMMWHIETAQDTADLDAESWSGRQGDPKQGAGDALPIARLLDTMGNVRAEGIITGDVPLLLHRTGSQTVRLERLEINGVVALFVPTAPLTPGLAYQEQCAATSHSKQANAEAISDHGFIGTGAMVATKEGPQPVDWLRAGDMVLTRDNGYQPILYLAQITLPPDTPPEYLPLSVPGETFGTGLPARQLTLTAGSQILLASPQLELLFGETEMFARLDQVKSNLRTRISTTRQALWSIVLPEPEVILAEGLWIGSALASPSFLDLLPERAATLIAPIVTQDHRYAARACLKDWEAEMFTRQSAIEARVAAA